MRSLFPGLLLLALWGCGPSDADQVPTPNRWSDERLWPILDAQDHRDVGRLCAFLADSSGVVREAAALALASVQNKPSRDCLLEALADSSIAVRATAAFGLGFIADSSAAVRMSDAALAERDTLVQRALLNASFIAMQRNGLLKDPNAILYYLDRSRGHERVRAADALRRMPDSVVAKMSAELVTLMNAEAPEVRQFVILALKKLGAQADTAGSARIARSSKDYGERVNAVRVLGALEGVKDDEFFFTQAGLPGTGAVALDVLRGRPLLSAEKCLYYERQVSDTTTRIALLGLAMQHGEHAEQFNAHVRLTAIADAVRSPYLKAEVITARANAGYNYGLNDLMAIVTSNAPAVERQAALQGAIHVIREQMERTRYASREAQYARLGEVVAAAVNTGDAGLICAIAEMLEVEEPDVIRILFPAPMEKSALQPLHPIRDMEARILLGKAITKRDGSPMSPPFDSAQGGFVPFNHPINKAKLQALKQGQQYRILTNKGEIVISTDVNECPGSSLVFDSLVMAGYYNGKAFHRMVPNFVAQGGCPRGDGYGGMPWTLRTEIGRTPFTAGSVGLASAGLDTESCQFFITHSAAPHLDGRYTRFGSVVSGMDVVWQLHVGDVMERVERAN